MLRKIMLVVVALMMAGQAAAVDEWTDAQRSMAVGVLALHVVNWGQHRAMAYSYRDVITTPLKGPALPGNPTGMARGYAEPDYGRVDRQFVLSAVAGAAVVHALPSEWRSRALAAGLVIEAGFVARQLQLGVGFRF